MKKSKQKKPNSSIKKKFISQSLREAILLFSLSISSYIYLTLTTYSKNDKSWINSSSDEVQNLGGLFGSYLSETLYFLFGQIAFLTPLLLIFVSILIYNRPRNDEDKKELIRYFGYFFVLISLCALFSIHYLYNNFEVGAGGILGDFIASVLVTNFNIVGSTIILVTFFELTYFC